MYEYNNFPKTRYNGSKYKLLGWIYENTKDIECETVLDAFGGTGSVSYLFKTMGKKVYYNDMMKFNSIIGQALIANSSVMLNKEDIDDIFNIHNGYNYKTIIQDNFKDIYYTEEENKMLDIVVQNIQKIEDKNKQSLLYFCLFQACIMKRPYNLFHRANLNVRLADVTRSFGNKSTWDKNFKEIMYQVAEEASKSIFDNGKECVSLNSDAMCIEDVCAFDLVYIDTPYISNKGAFSDYLDLYHFLEGIAQYDLWVEKINCKYKHKPLVGKGTNEWIKKSSIIDSFDKLIYKYKNSKIVISYREDGIPSIDDIVLLLKKHGKTDVVVTYKNYKYALAKNNSKECLIIAK